MMQSMHRRPEKEQNIMSAKADKRNREGRRGGKTKVCKRLKRTAILTQRFFQLTEILR